MKFIVLPFIFVVSFWLLITHPFEIPDEQSHYATVHYLVDQGRMPTRNDKKNLSLEEQETQYIFGIMTDGTNKYAYNPSYRMEYIDGFVGKYENEIAILNTQANRGTYTIHQAAIYPPLYYIFASILYQIVEKGDIIIRLFATRFVSVLFTALLIFVTYQIGRLIFRKRIYATTLATMVLFYPMTTYIGSGVNSDNLHNLLFAIFIYLCLFIIKFGWSKKYSFLLGSVIGLDLLTKPQAYIMLPILALAVLVRGRFEWRLFFRNIPYFAIPPLLLATWQELPKLIGSSPSTYVASVGSYGGFDNFVIYLRGFVAKATQEMLVWYWGVFKWTTVVLPRPFWWVANRLLFLSIFVVMYKLVRSIVKRKLTWLGKVSIFALGANTIYIAALFWFDWQFYQDMGHSLGMQARYYMPLLTLQMFLLLYGTTSLGWWNMKVKKWLRRGLVIFFLTLQLAAIYTQITSYYDTSQLSTLVSQISQYKPWFAKGLIWYLYGGMYITSVLYISLQALGIKTRRLAKS